MNSLVILFLLLNVFLFTIIYLDRSPDYPIGWDAPYYISNSNYLLENDILSPRGGTVSIIATINIITGVPLLELYIYLTIFLLFLISISSGLLAYKSLGNNVASFLLVFFLVFWYKSSYFLSVMTFDNAVSIILIVFSCYLLIDNENKFRKIIPIFVLTLIVGLIHIESYVYFSLIILVYSILNIFDKKSFKKFLSNNYGYISAYIISLIVVIIKWFDIIKINYILYTTPATEISDASVAYAQNNSIEEFIDYAKTGLNSNLAITFFLIAILIIIFYYFKKKNNKPIIILFSYIISSYLLVGFSIFKGSIPIDRSVLLLPVPLIIGVGIIFISKFLIKNTKFKMNLLMIILILIVMIPIPSQLNLIKIVKPSINQGTFIGYQSLNKYIKDNKITKFVILTNTKRDVKAASAYYFLWKNWMYSLLPINRKDIKGCIYFGSISSFIENESSFRNDNPEYNTVSNISMECVDSLNNYELFVITNLYPKFPVVNNGYYDFEKVNNYLYKVKFSVSPSDER